MSLKQFVDGSGELRFKDAFLSPRVLKKALAKRFRLVVVEETPHGLRCKIVRYGRLHGAPVLWSHPTLHLRIRRDGFHSTLSWSFRWPDYYMLFLIPVLVLAHEAASRTADFAFVPAAALWFVAFFLALIFLDTQWVARRVRRTSEELERQAS